MGRPTSLPSHPYYPIGVPIAGYRPNVTPLPVLLASFGSILAIVVASGLAIARRARPGLSLSDQLLICWFVLCGSLHCFFEGYFVLNHRQLAGSQGLLGQVWKEYALSDSRYLTSDPFTLCVEAVTVFLWGPLCFATAVSIARGRSLRYPLQTITCIAHLYGVALYYGTCYVELLQRGVSYSRPEFLYFWIYYVGMNAPWAVVPAIIMFGSLRKIQSVFEGFERVESTLRAASKLKPAQETKKTK